MALGLGVEDYDELGTADDDWVMGVDLPEEFEGNKGHFKLVKSLQQGASNKSKTRGAVRREAAPDVAEFSAVKRRSTGAPNMNHLLLSVKETGEGKALEKVTKLVKAPSKSAKNIKTLDTPLEKPVALKTKRTVLYNQAKKDVSRWNAVVYHNRLADQLVYPLNSNKKIPRKGGKEISADFIPMTPLEEEMAKVLYGEEYLKERKAALEKPTGPTDAEAYMLSVEEALSVHSEMARLRALQSYEMSKAKRQKKIKSKKYHRLLRKEKIKKQLKDFEQLQQTDPEGAMVKLTELEESRVEERMSLKHRNTTKWAKMQSARAKYNKDSRVALTEQLKISRDLTQKIQESSDEEEEDDMDMDIPQLVRGSMSKMDNPWMLNPEVQGNDKLQLYYSGYKKLWEEINAKKEQELKKQQALDEQMEAKRLVESKKEDKNLKNNEKGALTESKSGKKSSELEDDTNTNRTTTKSKNAKKNSKKQLRKIAAAAAVGNTVSKIQKESKITEEDEESEDDGFTEHDLEGLFEKAENRIKSQAMEKLKEIEKNEKNLKRLTKKQQKRKDRANGKNKKKSAKQKRGDEQELRELDVNSEEQNVEVFNSGVSGEKSFDLMTIRNEETWINKESKTTSKKSGGKHEEAEIINPDNYLKISKEKRGKGSKFDGKGIKELDFDALNDNEDEDDSQGMIIADAFEDDDVVAEFKKQKEDEIEGGKPKDINLHLPGWGEWGGKGIVPDPKKKARFTIKARPQAPRKDARLSHVILNEEASDKMKGHQVRELPYPFKRVKDFEKTIRAPIGRTWLPEQSTKDLIAPKVITRLGSVIQPLDEDVLVKSAENGVEAKVSKEFKVPMSIKLLAKTGKAKR